ncbi:hypothetical protein V6N13_118227 [Hibiscus sabdariffa]|uniref:Uncharacterized protein n=1 Tax=Hibiscus sabdariffa TaxID=183260 RepID=A0ABR2Q8Q5_9ROSI
MPRKPRILLAARGSVAAIKFANLCHCFFQWAEIAGGLCDNLLTCIVGLHHRADICCTSDEHLHVEQSFHRETSQHFSRLPSQRDWEWSNGRNLSNPLNHKTILGLGGLGLNQVVEKPIDST